jgi:hypothetical protein
MLGMYMSNPLIWIQDYKGTPSKAGVGGVASTGSASFWALNSKASISNPFRTSSFAGTTWMIAQINRRTPAGSCSIVRPDFPLALSAAAQT